MSGLLECFGLWHFGIFFPMLSLTANGFGENDLVIDWEKPNQVYFF